jgi:hypothetical protein
MTWLTWRQFRAAAAMLFAALATLATLAAVLALTGPGLADDYATGIAACTTQPGGCSDFVPSSSTTTRAPSWRSPPWCWSCPP